ncbi:sporulation protein [Shewanella sp. WXL01]|uniref:Sporulation protein n=1 Tax=Shewanella maritima TaxID=2520507 RepID=A0A411PIE1_9GAMM|nr:MULTISPECIES: SPOR domain-containing protein [Shewanella]NKF52329.1 sporulation protein [Shewanella sp. WXL01]QBF83313.1 sporulation protein [Shewanella maritima]
MSRDYANRKPRNAKPRSSRGKKAPAKKPVPFGIILFTVSFAAGFIYFLYWLATSDAPTPVEPAPVVKEQTKPKPKPKAQDELPPKPQQKWTYQEELENKQIEVDIPESEMVQVKLYQMQCGSFRKESQAEQLKARIAFQGMEAQVKRTEGTTGLWYKVVLGPFEGKRKAESQRHILQRGGINGCKIWLWQ